MNILNKVAIGVLVVTLTLGMDGLSRANAATAVNLGAADNFAILAATEITNTGSSVINGDLGLSPGAAVSITGFPPGTLNGTQHAANATSAAAQVALTAAYTYAAAQTPVTRIVTELGGANLTAGTYDTADGTFGLTGTLTLDAQGNTNAVFIFKTVSTLTTAGSSVIVLANGAQACNVFWQIGSSATLGTNSIFKGNILAQTAITLTTGANVEGRLLARDAAVTLDSNTVTKATCTAPPPVSGFSPALAAGPVAVPPLISVVKVPSPLALPGGPGIVTYNYTVLNIGTIAINNVKVSDNKCAPVTYESGDTNGNSRLGLTESWKYSCTTTLAQTTVNTVTATGEANGFTAIDTANATVVVGVALPPPLIHILKKPNVFVLPVGGGAVTYSYAVTNPGTAPLSNVSVIDDKCTGLPGRVVGHPGDLNKNDLLESNETWSFTCLTNLTETTINTGTAEGSANGLTAIDYSLATVVVAVAAPAVVPTLPSAGNAPGNSLWSTIAAAGILAIGALVFVARRKQKQS